MEVDEVKYYELGMVRSDEILALHFNDGWVINRIVDGGYPTEMTHTWPECAASVAVGPQASAAVPDYIKETVSANLVKLLKQDGQGDVIDEYIFGWSEPHADIWQFFPENQAARRQFRAEIGAAMVTAASETNFGKLMRGVESPIHAPTTKGRLFIVNSEDQEPKWAIYNPSGKSITVKQRIIRNPLKFEAMDPSLPDDAKIIELVIRNQITKGVTKWSPGIEGWAIKDFRKTFGVNPVKWCRFPIKGLKLGYQTAKDGIWHELGV